MIVSFDLDDTLFVSPDNFKVEPELSFPFNRIYRERLRKGTIELMTWVRGQGIQIWIYTTSFRTERYIRGLFRHYGIRLDSVAKKNDIHSIAFPAISTGAYRYPIEEALTIALESVIEWLEINRDYEMNVIFSCFSQKIYDQYQRIIRVRFDK